ncbi:hypothetical protein C8R45DRAFT_986881 [Mycena sanguinolenta]|nr:hypothetical protein C8R45DRAFT_986881 [Mycena sanguinolenta]
MSLRHLWAVLPVGHLPHLGSLLDGYVSGKPTPPSILKDVIHFASLGVPIHRDLLAVAASRYLNNFKFIVDGRRLATLSTELLAGWRFQVKEHIPQEGQSCD